MSNCLTLQRDVVQFSAFNADLPRIAGEARLHAAHPPYIHPLVRSASDPTFALNDTWCWYLKINSFFLKQGMIWQVQFRDGNSSHTWRSLRWTCAYISQWVLEPVTHTFHARDEGAPGWFNLKVEFHPGHVILAGQRIDYIVPKEDV